MRSLGDRLNLLKKLINLRCGPGAAILPPEVTRIHLDFAFKIHGGHMGARKFWRENLPRLKYHNPAVPIIINRHHENDTPPTMTIYMRSADRPAAAESPDSTTPLFSSHSDLAKAPQPAPGERAVRIDMKDKHSSEILHSFMTETSATPLQPTAEDISEMQALDALRQRGDIDRERVRQERAEKKREEDMLKRARAAGGMEDMEAS